jgi:glycosyl transferase family 25
MEVFGGVYVINLDRRADRLKDFEAEMATLELPFKRFSAIERKPGGLGCSLSHLAVLKEARALGLKNVLIFEDDFTPLVSKSEFWEEIQNLFENHSNFDVCMLAYAMIKEEAYTERLIKVIEAQTASAYIVNACFYDTLIELYERSVPLLEKTWHHWLYMNDQAWKTLQPSANWFACKKRIGYQRPSISDSGYAPVFTDYKV